jgi:hypothetical protein
VRSDFLLSTHHRQRTILDERSIRLFRLLPTARNFAVLAARPANRCVRAAGAPLASKPSDGGQFGGGTLRELRQACRRDFGQLRGAYRRNSQISLAAHRRPQARSLGGARRPDGVGYIDYAELNPAAGTPSAAARANAISTLRSGRTSSDCEEEDQRGGVPSTIQKRHLPLQYGRSLSVLRTGNAAVGCLPRRPADTAI